MAMDSDLGVVVDEEGAVASVPGNTEESRFAADAKRIIDESASSEDRKHTS